MKICVIGAPSTGKSTFARSISAELTRNGNSCELVQEYATRYIQQVGAPAHPWEQLMIAIGQHTAEQVTTRDHIVTDAAAFVTYIYAQRAIPKQSEAADWPRYRHLLDVLRTLARESANSYDIIFLLNYVFPPQPDGVRAKEHLSREACQAINDEIAEYLQSERVEFHRLKANDSKALSTALQLINQRLVIHRPEKTPS